MADEIQLLQQAKHLGGQISASEQNAVTIFAALLMADAIRESVGGGQISASEQNAVTIFAALLMADAIRESVGHLTRLISERRE